MSDNPFTMVYDALWELAERNTRLTNLIRLRNRIKYDNALDPKYNIEDGDLPELALESMGADSNIMNSSSTSRVTRNYAWAITTGEFEINPFYNTVCWELYRAMVDWDQVLCALEWPEDWNFVVKAQTINVDEGTLMFDRNRSISGWAGIWAIEVEMHFSTESLRIS